MMTLEASDMALLRSLSGSDLALEVANMSTKYGIPKATIMAMLPSQKNSEHLQFADYDPRHKQHLMHPW